MAADPRWVAAGSLTGIHVGLVFDLEPVDIERRIQESAQRYAFDDWWSGTGRKDLNIAATIVDLGKVHEEFDLPEALSEVLRRAEAQLDADSAAFTAEIRERDRLRLACADFLRQLGMPNES